MPTLFQEMKRYVRFGEADEVALRALAPIARPEFARIADEFYQRLSEHEAARKVFSGPEQVARLKITMVEWLRLLLEGPWDQAYFEKRARIGHVHVRVGLAQRYMLGAMNVHRVSLTAIALGAYAHDPVRRAAAITAIQRILDVELAVMLESFRVATLERAQEVERHEMKLLERELKLSQARYQEIVEAGEALIVTVDPEGRIQLFNRRCEELTGISRADAVGQDWLHVFDGDEDPRLILRLEERAERGERVPPAEHTLTAADGTHHRVRWHFTSIPGPTDGRPFLCALGVDISGEHELQARARRSERLASLGTMAAGLAHEIRNPLNAAHLQLTLLQRRLGRATPDVDGARTAAQVISQEMTRLASLVEEFLQFARPQPLRLSEGDLRATCGEVVALLEPEAHASGSSLLLGAGPAVRARYDPERMKQVLINLVRNALEASGSGGHVQLQVAASGDEGDALLRIVDDGPGLPNADAPIFEPFFTTKDGGTGLGLAIVHRIVSDHGGRIDVDSHPGRTVFSVTLPRSA